MTDRDTNRALTEEEKIWVFMTATRSFAHRYADRIAGGMTDSEIAGCLADCLGWGGVCGPGEPDVMYKGSGLKIWGGWAYQRESNRPLFQGKQTVAMARHVYGIPDPDNPQGCLF